MNRWCDVRGRWAGRLSLVDAVIVCLAVWLYPAVRFTAALAAGSLGLRVTAIEPNRVAAGMTHRLRVEGYDFSGVSRVSFGDRPVDEVAVLSDTALSVELPSDMPAGYFDVQVSSGRRTSVLQRALEVMAEPEEAGPEPQLSQATWIWRAPAGSDSPPAPRIQRIPVEFECIFFGLRREDIGRLRADAMRAGRGFAAPAIVRVASHGRISPKPSRSTVWEKLPKAARLPACQGVPESPFGTWWALTTLHVPADVRETSEGTESRYANKMLAKGEQLNMTIRDAKLSCAVVNAPRLMEGAP